MLKDNIEAEALRIEKEKEKRMSENMNMNFRGEVEVWGIDENDKVYHHEKDSNIVTNFAKHATMHLMSGEIYSTHGNRQIDGITAYSRRDNNNHTTSANYDGTMISNEQYLGDNTNYDKYWSLHNTAEYPINTNEGDLNGGSFNYPLFPTKMLLGTGIEYASWQEIINEGKDGTGQDGYGNVSNGGWTASTFNDRLISGTIEKSNYYSAKWNGIDALTKCRTLNDVYLGALSEAENPMTPDNFGVKGAIKNATYNGTNQAIVLAPIDGKWFAKDSYRGIGQPAFIYAKRGLRYMNPNSEAKLELGVRAGTEYLESKLTYTVIMPKQELGEFYPYNGYTVKVAGLFADAGMLLKNTVPLNATENDDVSTTNREFDDYTRQPGGIMWATRNIAPITKNHNTSIVVQWTIYL